MVHSHKWRGMISNGDPRSEIGKTSQIQKANQKLAAIERDVGCSQKYWHRERQKKIGDTVGDGGAHKEKKNKCLGMDQSQGLSSYVSLWIYIQDYFQGKIQSLYKGVFPYVTECDEHLLFEEYAVIDKTKKLYFCTLLNDGTWQSFAYFNKVKKDPPAKCLQ